MHSDNVNGAARAPFKSIVIVEASRTFLDRLRFRFVETAKKKEFIERTEKIPNNEKWKRYFSHFYALHALEAF